MAIKPDEYKNQILFQKTVIFSQLEHQLNILGELLSF